MIGGALFHMLPASLVNLSPQTTFAWVAAGFTSFFASSIFTGITATARQRSAASP